MTDATTALQISVEEIAYLANGKVPEGSSQECANLADDMWTNGQNNPVEPIFVNKSSATEYIQTLEGRAGILSCHVDETTIVHSGHSHLWKRTDPRVSKEKCEIKFYMNYRNEKMSLQHNSKNTDSKAKKVDIPFSKIMGIEICNGCLSADVFGPPQIEQKASNSRVWETVSSSTCNTDQSFRVTTLFHKHMTPQDLQQKLELSPPLQSAFRTGLRTRYPNFDPTVNENPYERLPIVRDPTLVRATQLAILHLRQHVDNAGGSNVDVVSLVCTFGGIQQRFRVLLKHRLLKRCRKSRSEQPEE